MKLLLLLASILIIGSFTILESFATPMGGCPTNWPVYSIGTPNQVKIGENFDVIIDYSYAIPDKDAGYAQPDDVFEPEKYPESCLKSEILIRTPEFVKIIDHRYILLDTAKLWYFSPPFIQSAGVVPYDFDNTGPHQEIITMRVDTPRFGDQLDELYISPGHTNGATRAIVTHDDTAEIIEVETRGTDWSAEDYEQQKELYSNIRSTYGILDPIKIHNQTWIDSLKPERLYNTIPPQGNPPDFDEYAKWLLQVPFPGEMRETIAKNRGMPIKKLADAYPGIFSSESIAKIEPGLIDPKPAYLQKIEENISPIIKPPKKQIEYGIFPSKVECKQGLELIFKSSNNSPVCVKPSTAEKLIERGWAPEVFISNPRFFDFDNNELDEAFTDESIILELEIQNLSNREFPFTTLWSIENAKNSNKEGNIEETWYTGYFTPKQNSTLTLGWQSCFPGNYSIVLEVIDNINNRKVLSNQEKTSISIIGEPIPDCYENDESTLIID